MSSIHAISGCLCESSIPHKRRADDDREGPEIRSLDDLDAFSYGKSDIDLQLRRPQRSTDILNVVNRSFLAAGFSERGVSPLPRQQQRQQQDDPVRSRADEREVSSPPTQPRAFRSNTSEANRPTALYESLFAGL